VSANTRCSRILAPNSIVVAFNETGNAALVCGDGARKDTLILSRSRACFNRVVR